jgi:hypothetical protein
MAFNMTEQEPSGGETAHAQMGRGGYLYIVQMDVPAELEDEFNRIYDTEHNPQFLKVPGIRNCWRYRLVQATNSNTPRYTAIFEVDSPEVIDSPQARAAREVGEWKTKIAPYVTNRLSQLVQLVGPTR